MDLESEERINNALDRLKKELIEMRNMDVKLMRQLLNINDTIQKMTKGYTMTRTQSCKSRISTKKLSRKPQPKEVTEPPIRRLQSTPSFCRLNSAESGSSVDTDFPDSVGSSDNMFYINNSEEDVFMKESSMPRFNSMSCPAPLDERLGDDSCYEELLRANIKVWKSSHKQETDC